jgi:hypothetical protein
MKVDDIMNDIVMSNKIKRYASELNEIKNTDSKRIDELKVILASLNVQTNTEEHIPKVSNLDNIYKKVNDNTLHWKWNKLSIPQQHDRIKEFITRKITNNSKKEKAEALLVSMVDKKILKKNIVYDSINAIITEITLSEYINICDELSESGISDQSDQTNESDDSD